MSQLRASLFLFAAVYGGMPTANLRGPEAESPAVHFSAHISDGVHKLSEVLPIEVRVENTGKNTVYVYGDLNYFITLFALTSQGKGLPVSTVVETLPPPPAGPDEFAKLEPGKAISETWQIGLSDLGIKHPGAYQLKLSYRSHLAPDFSFGLPMWTGDQTVVLPITLTK